MVSHFIIDTKEWDVMKLKELVDDVHLQLILATPIPSHPIPDSDCWGLLGNGDFSTKTATWAAHGLDIKSSPSWEYSWIWHMDIMPKLKVFLWQLCHASLLTRGTLLKCGFQPDAICPICNANIEDMKHLFLQCPVQDVWQLAKDHNWVHITMPPVSSDSVQIWLSKLRASATLAQFDRIVALLWSI